MRVTVKFDGLLNEYDAEKLIEQPKIITVNSFSEESVKEFAEAMAAAENQRNCDVIPVVVNSYGGSVYELLAMVDIVRSSKKSIMTVIEGKAMSAGGVLASCGTPGFRYAAPYSTIMLHDIASYSAGKYKEIKADFHETERLERLLLSILDANAKKPPGFFEKEFSKRERVDWYATPIEARMLGLVDVVGVPTIEYSVDVSCKIG